MLETLCCDFGNGNVSIVVRDAEMKCEGDKKPRAVPTHQAGCLNAGRLLVTCVDQHFESIRKHLSDIPTIRPLKPKQLNL